MSENPDPSIIGGGSQMQNKEPKSKFSIRKIIRFLRIFPWTFLLIGIAVIVDFLPGTIRGTTLDYVLIVFALVVFVIEIIKGADIRIGRFILDLTVAIVGVVIVTALLTYNITRTGTSPAFYQWVVAAVVILDALISTSIAFSTALRNMAVGYDR